MMNIAHLRAVPARSLARGPSINLNLTRSEPRTKPETRERQLPRQHAGHLAAGECNQRG